MIKRNILAIATIFLVAFTVYPQGQNGEMDKVILEQADAMGKSFVAKDYTTFAKYTHPSVVKRMGGEKKMIAETTKSFQELEAEQITFLDVTFGIPSKIINHENELQCTLAQMIVMKVPGGTLTAHTTLIALSKDNGKHWYFIDTSGNNINNLKLAIPTLSPDLDVPMPQDPSFEKDKITEP